MTLKEALIGATEASIDIFKEEVVRLIKDMPDSHPPLQLFAYKTLLESRIKFFEKALEEFVSEIAEKLLADLMKLEQKKSETDEAFSERTIREAVDHLGAYIMADIDKS